MRHAIVVRCFLLTLMAVTVACQDPPNDPRLRVAAYVGDQPVYVSEVEKYFESNLIEDDSSSALPAEAIDEVKSRLFDAMLEERMFYVEAEEREIQVNDLEVETYLDMGGSDPPDDPELSEWRAVEARQRLMVQKLQEQVIRDQQRPTDEEVAEYAAEHSERLLPTQPLELRALQLASMNQAKRVRRDIRRKRITFSEAALVHDPSPGQAMPLKMSWDSLSTELQEALEGLKPGQISEPMELHGSIYLFQVGTWLKDQEDQDEERLRRARLELESIRRRDALDDLAVSLRQRSGVRINTENLPFVYIPVDQAGDPTG